MIEKKVVVNLAVGLSARRRLDEFARSTGLPLGVVLERAIMAYEPGASVALNEPRITALESRIEALESALAALKEQVAIIYQPEPEGAENGSCAAVGHNPNLDDGETSAAAHLVSGEVKEEPNLMENEAVLTPSPILSKSVKRLIGELVAGGERSPTRIANALNDAGFRTQTGTCFERSNPQIKKALDAARGK